MATLSAIFRLTDNYTSALNRIMSDTDRATASIGKASASTDNLNNAFNSSGNAASALTSKITMLIGTIATLATIKKAMDISDEYTNTNSKLSLITSNLTQQRALQDQIFAAADRARGSYSVMADTVAKLGITSLDKFGNTANVVKFTETMQKMFKIGGTNTAGQSGAMLQLQQAIGLGKLQGQDLRILAEDAPLVEKAIAKYMGKSVGEVKALGTSGKITSQVLINSILNYSGTVDQQMSKMKYTWGDYWNKISNGATKAFSGVFESESKVLGSASFKNGINGIVASFNGLAKVASAALSGVVSTVGFVGAHLSVIAPIIGGIVTAMLIYNAVALVTKGIAIVSCIASYAYAAAMGVEASATAVATTAQYGLNTAFYANPITWVIALVVALAAVFVLLWENCAGFRAFWADMWVSEMDIAAAAYNFFSVIFNNMSDMINSFSFAFVATEEIFRSSTTSIVAMVGAMSQGLESSFGIISTSMNVMILAYNAIAKLQGKKTIDFTVNSKSTSAAIGLTTKSTIGSINKAAAGTTALASVTKIGKLGSIDTKKYDALIKSYGGKIKNFTVSGWLNGQFDKAMAAVDKASKSSTGKSKITTVKGTGTGGSVSVNMADEDLAYLRDLAEKDYTAKFSSSTLAPHISVKFTGAISKEVDTDKMYGRIGKILKQEITTASEGAR